MNQPLGDRRLAPEPPNQHPAAKKAPTTARALFWTFFGLGFVAMILAWNGYALAQFEAQTEQPKALAANTTMAGFAELTGGVPLVLAHLVGAGLLLPFGWRAWRWKGLAIGAASVVAASIVGILSGQLLWEGELFELGITNTSYQP